MLFQTRIIGRVGRDPEVRDVNGKKITTYSVATNPTKDKTVWVKVTVWDKRADLDAQYVKKGMLIECEGTLQSDDNGYPRSYTDKEGNMKVSNFELTAYQVRYLSKGEERTRQTSDADVEYGSSEPEFPF